MNCNDLLLLLLFIIVGVIEFGILYAMMWKLKKYYQILGAKPDRSSGGSSCPYITKNPNGIYGISSDGSTIFIPENYTTYKKYDNLRTIWRLCSIFFIIIHIFTPNFTPLAQKLYVDNIFCFSTFLWGVHFLYAAFTIGYKKITPPLFVFD